MEEEKIWDFGEEDSEKVFDTYSKGGNEVTFGSEERVWDFNSNDVEDIDVPVIEIEQEERVWDFEEETVVSDM